MTTREAARNPIYGVLSGPSGGVAGALFVARKAGYDDILTFDMGGTSTDVALCQNGQPTIGRETAIGHFRIKVPSVNVHTVGAGGGSIAHVPELTKALRVGPQSAGAEPGPAAYGKGGDRADRHRRERRPRATCRRALLGGEMELDVEAARAAVQKVADAMGLDSVEQAAEGILAIVNENMAGALRLVSVQRGHDPREFALVAYGGAGPLHANALAKLMGSFPVIVPPAPGLLCAIGDLVADFRDEFAQTYIRLLDRGERRPRSRTSSTGSAAARQAWLEGEGIADGRPADRLQRRHALPPPGLRDPGRARPGRGARQRARPTSRSASTACTSSSTGSGCRAPPARSSTCARSGTAPCRSPSCRSASAASADAVGRRRRRARGRLRRRSGVPTKIYDRAKLAAGRDARGPGDRHRVRLDDGRPARLPRPRSTATSTS